MAIKFQQWANAFDGTTTETGCSVSIDAAGVITSTIQSASDTADQATENITTNLPAGEEGRARFYYTAPATWNALANMVFFHVEAAGAVQILELYQSTTSKTVSVFSPAGRIFSAGVNSAISPAFVPGSEHLIEVAWRKNAFIKVWIDGSLAVNLTGSGAASSAVPVVVNVGIHHYDGADGSGATAKFRLFQLADSADDVLADPPGSLPAEMVKVLDKFVGPGAWQLVSTDSASTATNVDAQRLEELIRVAKVNYYEVRYASGLVVLSPKR